MERFYYYVFGIHFTLVTDHKALEVLFRPRSKPCARIERWVLRIQSYNFAVKYRPGTANIADPLSRLCEGVDDSFDEEAEHYTNSIVQWAKPVAINLNEIADSSEKDCEIQLVKMGLNEEIWDQEILAFKIIKTELCFAGNILLRNNRIVMPKDLRVKSLELGHEGHPGATIMKRRLRSKLWWPKMDEEIENYVKRCRGCLLVSAADPSQPLKVHDLPSGPWQQVAIDFMGPIDDRYYLLVVIDYFSRFKEVEIMTKTDTKTTIERLEIMFARFGYPTSLRADNGPQFDSREFKAYCAASGIKLMLTTPYSPQQNGEVERQNRSLLKRLTISYNTNSNWKADLQDYLLMYRVTPHTVTGKPPAELMFGRNIRDKLPNISAPIDVDEAVVERDKLAKEKGKVEKKI